MTQDDKEFLKEFLRGFGGASIVFIGICLVLSFIIYSSGSTKPSQNNFEVVDTYKGCDVVQYTNSHLAEYKYFLHCNNTRPVYEQ